MPSPISRRPSGLLDLLLTQQQGKNPSTLLDDVLPVLEMRPFYAQDRLTVEREALAVTASGIQATQIDVPQGESWMVFGFGLRIEYATAAQSCTADLLIDISSVTFAGITFAPSATNVIDPGFASQEMNNGFLLPQPIAFPSGTEFKLDLQRINLDGQPNLLMLFSCLYTRMET